MTVLDFVIRRRGISEVDVRSITQLPTCMVYEVRLWNRRRLRIAAYEVSNA